MDKKDDYKDIFEQFFYESLDALVLLDIERNEFVLFNNSTLKLYGYTKEEFEKITPYDLSVEFTDNYKMENKQQHIYERGWDKFITKHKTKEAKVLDIYVKSKRIKYKDRFLLFITLIDLEKELNSTGYLTKIKAESRELITIQEIYKWDQTAKVLFKNNVTIELTSKEKQLLSLLIQNLNNNISYNQINSYFGNTLSYNSLLSSVKRIRKKTSNHFIQTVYSKGYIINSIKA